MACNTLNYQFTPIPTQLFLCLDNNCRSVLFALIQLSTYFESKGGITDGWFFRTNADLEAETGLSKNVLSGALDALYQKKIIGIVPQEAGKGKKQESRKYKVFFDEFLKYEEIPIEECYKNPEHKIKTADYKKGIPTFQQILIPTSQQTSLPTSQPTFGKSDNNIDNIENIDKINNLDKENSILLKSNLLNNNILYNKNHFFDSKSISVFKDKFEDEMNESEMKSENAEKKTEKQAIAICQSKGKPDKVEARCDDEGQGGGSASSSMPSLLSEEVKDDIMEARRLANSLDGYFLYGDVFDNYTEQANTLLDEDSNSVYLMLRSIDEEEEWSDSALENLSEKLCSFEYQDDDEYIMTLKDLWSYYLKRTKREKEEKEEMGFECVN